MKKRALQIIISILVFIILGLGYGLFYMATGIGVPCIFHKITGWRCPGCGVTRMCVALMHGNFTEAMHHNSLLFFLTPLLLFIFGDYMIGYIRTGHWKIRRWETIAFYVMIVLLVVFGIVRNLV